MVEQFISRLTSNPNFMGQPSSTVELHICNFILQNKQSLAPVLTQQLYPGSGVEDAAKLLMEAVVLTMGEQILSNSKAILKNCIDLNILNDASIHIESSQEEIINYFINFYQQIIKHRDARQKIDAVNTIFSEQMIENYVHAAFENKSYLYNELYRVDTHHFSAEAVIEYLKLTLLITPGFGIAVPISANTKPVAAGELKTDNKRLEKYFQQIMPILRQMLPFINEDFWKSAKSVFLDYGEHPEQEPTAKFLAILLLRAKDFRKMGKIEKGAETPDKSWFSVHMRNAGFLGLDKSLLEDLNRLAFDMRK